VLLRMKDKCLSISPKELTTKVSSTKVFKFAKPNPLHPPVL
jgi:hypothetical protein